MRDQKRPETKHKQIPRPRQQHVAEQRKNQAKADPAPIVAGRCVVQPAEQGQYGQWFDQQTKQRRVHAHAIQEGHGTHQCQNQPAHDQLTEIAQSKVSTGNTSGAQGCCEVRRKRPVPAVKA